MVIFGKAAPKMIQNDPNQSKNMDSQIAPESIQIQCKHDPKSIVRYAANGFENDRKIRNYIDGFYPASISLEAYIPLMGFHRWDFIAMGIPSMKFIDVMELHR